MQFSIHYGILILLAFVLIIVIGLCTGVKSCDCVSKESNSIGEIENYQNMDKYINHLKKNKSIGVPSGLLSYLPEQTNCDSNRNLIVQDKVTFKPTNYKDGCTYIDLQYPGAL